MVLAFVCSHVEFFYMYSLTSIRMGGRPQTSTDAENNGIHWVAGPCSWEGGLTHEIPQKALEMDLQFYSEGQDLWT